MMTKHACQVAYAQIRSRWRSSILSALGVIICTTTLILTSHCSHMALESLLDNFKSQGTQLFTIYIRDFDDEVNIDDLNTLLLTNSEIKSIHPMLTASLSLPNDTHLNIIGTTSNYTSVLPTEILKGRQLHSHDQSSYIVLTQGAQEYLKKNGAYTYLGGQLNTDSGLLNVIGITSDYTPLLYMQRYPDGVGVVSLETFKDLTGFQNISQVIVRVGEDSKISEVSEFANKKLKKAYPDLYFQIIDPLGMIQGQSAQMLIFKVIIYLGVSICALLGGIGIMNMTMATIDRRRGEIALRIALGATKADIKSMLILESSLLCIICGTFGIIIGLMITILIAKLASWALVILPSAIIESLAFSCVVGIFSAIAPAKRIQKIPIAYILKGE